MKTIELIERAPISEELRAALLPAIAKAGKWRGSLLANAPATNIAWQVLVGFAAPARVKVWGMMGENAARFNHLDDLAVASGINWARALSATEPYARWNADGLDLDRDAILREIEPHLLPAKATVTKKRAHPCVEFLDVVADALAAGFGDMLHLGEFKDDRGHDKFKIKLLWENTTLNVVMDNNVAAIRDRADRLDQQVRGHKAKGEGSTLKEYRRMRNWKPSYKVVPLSPERAAECGMEVVA